MSIPRMLAPLAATVCITAMTTGSSAQIVAESLGEGAARFYPGAPAKASAQPSFSLAANPQVGPMHAGYKIGPGFFKTPEGKAQAVIPVTLGTSFYGTGEVYGPLLRNGRKAVCWNTDAYGYGAQSASLYQSHPWVLAVRPDGTAFGVLADTTWRCEIDLTDGIRFTADGPEFPIITIDRASPQEVVTTLATLIGTMPLPPKWAIGYHQCRYSYNPEARVREIAAGFRDRHIPCDAIWFDIDYMDGYRVFTFDKAQFPDPSRLNSDLQSQGFRCIWTIDPGVKREPGFGVYDQLIAKGLAVKNSKGEPYVGDVWPGQCVFPDYTRPDALAWWAGLYKDFMATGIDGVWNDMNEPAIFNVSGRTMPDDNRHDGGVELPSGKVPPGPHARFHNVYGMLMARGTHEGILAANPDKRPFVLSRAGYIGSHRYAATWTGDNSADWNHLEASIPMVLNLGLSGQPFCGPDIGGFIGDGDAKLFARWMGVGSMLPFSRGHTGKGTINKEPWAFGPEVEATCRRALERRYRLLPYIYTVFREAAQTGMPVARPVMFADPKDLALRSEDDCFLLGGDLLVVCRVTPLRDRAPSLPKGEWRSVSIVAGDDADTDLPDLRIRPGAIVPIGPIIEHTSQKPLDPLTLLVNLDENGRARGTLYEDAGDGFGYRQGEYLLTTFEATTEDGAVKVRTAASEGNMAVPQRNLQVIVVK